MDLEQALRRIKLENVKRELTLQTLNELCLAFVSNIPFETLDLVGQQKKTWHFPTIYEQIVVKKRGGFCYDLNVLFQWILKVIGFKVEMLKGYQYEDDTFDDRSDHMSLMVTLQSGEKWLTDVGWGGACFALPLRLELDVEQNQPNGIYRLSKTGEYFTVEKKKQTYLDVAGKFASMEEEVIATTADGNCTEKWNVIYGFNTTSYQFEDFRADFEYTELNSHMLRNNAIVVLQNRQGRKYFFNNMFMEKEYVSPQSIRVVQMKKCTPEEVAAILKNEFGIVIDFKLEIKSGE